MVNLWDFVVVKKLSKYRYTALQLLSPPAYDLLIYRETLVCN